MFSYLKYSFSKWFRGRISLSEQQALTRATVKNGCFASWIDLRCCPCACCRWLRIRPHNTHRHYCKKFRDNTAIYARWFGWTRLSQGSNPHLARLMLDKSIDWLIDQLIDRLIDRWIGPLIDWLIDFPFFHQDTHRLQRWQHHAAPTKMDNCREGYIRQGGFYGKRMLESGREPSFPHGWRAQAACGWEARWGVKLRSFFGSGLRFGIKVQSRKHRRYFPCFKFSHLPFHSLWTPVHFLWKLPPSPI